MADVLEITNIRASVQNYNDKERGVKEIDTLGGHQKVIFLTSRGVYRLLFSSKKKIAEQFREWVGDIMDDIIFNQSKKLKEQLDNQILLKEKLELKEKEHQDNLVVINKRIEELENRPETMGFIIKNGYIYLISDIEKKGHYKIGLTNDLKSRVSILNISSSTHSLILKKYWETCDKFITEKMCHSILEPFKIKSRNEWFYVKNDNELAYIINTINKCVNFVNNYDYKNMETFNNMINTIDKSVLKNIDDVNCTISNANQKFKQRNGLYKGVSFNKKEKKWEVSLTYNGKKYSLGHYKTEELGGIAYNDFALYLNNTYDDSNYSINEIENYVLNPRNVYEENKLYKDSIKTSKYVGVSYVKKHKTYQVQITYKHEPYFLGHFKNEEDGAKIYNKQALYFNNHFNTKYILNNIENYETIEENIIKNTEQLRIEKETSKYTGVSYSKQAKKWQSVICKDKKKYHLGFFTDEISAVKKYNEKAIEFNKQLELEKKHPRYKINNYE